MRRSALGALILAAVVALVPARAFALADLSFRSDVATSPDPATTEEMWVFDPGAWNPHRRSWVTERKVELAGLRAVDAGGGYSRVEAAGVVARSLIHLRAGEKRYSELRDFPC